MNDDYVKELAAFAISELNRKSVDATQRRIIRIVKAHHQVVSGTMMHMTLELGLINAPDGQSEMCAVKVWDQPWLNRKELFEVKLGSE